MNHPMVSYKNPQKHPAYNWHACVEEKKKSMAWCCHWRIENLLGFSLFGASRGNVINFNFLFTSNNFFFCYEIRDEKNVNVLDTTNKHFLLFIIVKISSQLKTMLTTASTYDKYDRKVQAKLTFSFPLANVTECRLFNFLITVANVFIKINSSRSCPHVPRGIFSHYTTGKFVADCW